MIKLTSSPLIEKIYQELKLKAQSLSVALKRRPHLVVILVGKNEASLIYIKKKEEIAKLLGLQFQAITFPENVSPQDLSTMISALNQDPRIDGIILQRPLPSNFKEADLATWIAPEKDVDGFHPQNIGSVSAQSLGFTPCTPLGILKLLKFYQIPIEGKVVCIVGRSPIVGRPMSHLMTRENATVILTHSKTQDLSQFTKQADILIVAAGKPALIHAEDIKPGAVVIDVGIHRIAGNKIIGDVDYISCSKVASAITPVPGGIGPLTVAMLFENTLTAAERNFRS